MTLYKQQFSIKDLENFSGIKAHTIRIWEKRYSLFSPQRTESNIRLYDMDDLKAILKISYLNNHGQKISNLASLSKEQLNHLVQEIALVSHDESEAINGLKIAMLNFDELMFESIISKASGRHGFTNIVEKIFLPLLIEIGILWQSNAICPSHEHFVSNLIRQKLFVAVDKSPYLPEDPKKPVYCLFLPENEIHELGLLYLHYIIRSQGIKSIYLGQSVPADDLIQVYSIYKSRIVFVSIFTTDPNSQELNSYLKQLDTVFTKKDCEFLITGNQFAKAEVKKIPKRITVFSNFLKLTQYLKNQ